MTPIKAANLSKDLFWSSNTDWVKLGILPNALELRNVWNYWSLIFKQYLLTVGPNKIPAIISAATGGCLRYPNPKVKILHKIIIIISCNKNTLTFGKGASSSFKGLRPFRTPNMFLKTKLGGAV